MLAKQIPTEIRGGRTLGLRRRASPTAKTLGWGAALVALGIIAFIYRWWWTSEEMPPPATPSPPIQPAPKTASEAQIRFPIPRPQTGTSALPPPDQSDAELQNVFGGLIGDKGLRDLLYREGIIRRFVVTVDNLPEPQLPRQTLVVRPPAGHFLVANGGGAAMWIDSENAARYAPYVRLAEVVDARRLVGIYVHFYPLMQQQYRDLGYVNGYFNDRLIDAIDDLLRTPDMDGPVELVQPKVMYEFADPDLEARSAGQKIMLRMGIDNAAKIKNKLREIRRLLVGSRVATP